MVEEERGVEVCGGGEAAFQPAKETLQEPDVAVVFVGRACAERWWPGAGVCAAARVGIDESQDVGGHVEGV